jgi:hypothetical protein
VSASDSTSDALVVAVEAEDIASAVNARENSPNP